MHELVKFLELAIVGAGGALTYTLLKDKGIIILPHRWKNGTKHGIDLGIIAGILLGAIAGILVDHSLLTAFLGALSAPTVIEQAIKREI